MSKKFVYTKVSQNIITWAPTLADSASLHLCIDCVVFVGSWKNALMTANRVRYSPFSYQIFAMQVKAARFKYVVCKDIDFPRKKEQKYMRQSTFLSLCVDDSCDAKTHCIIAKNVREGFMVFSGAFLNTDHI
jgi:hypothetical protein